MPPGLTGSGRSFVAGIDGFCRAYYLSQRAVDEQYPQPAAVHRQDVLLMILDHKLFGRLGRLQPPPSLSAAFGRFVANEQRLGQALTREASLDPTMRAEGFNEAEAAIVLRHGYGGRLGARECDGLLPPDQWVQVVRAAQRFDLASGVHQDCVDLVDPAFLPSRYPAAKNQLAACARDFRGHRAGDPRPHNIRVTDVTGVERLSATVHFREVPECGCGNLVIRLYYRQGRWLVRDAYTE
jgi:hypothetical protein